MHAYGRIVAYVTAGAYRHVVEAAFAESKRAQGRGDEASSYPSTPLILTRATSRGTGTKDLLSHASLRELLDALYPDMAKRHDPAAR